MITDPSSLVGITSLLYCNRHLFALCFIFQYEVLAAPRWRRWAAGSGADAMYKHGL